MYGTLESYRACTNSSEGGTVGRSVSKMQSYEMVSSPAVAGVSPTPAAAPTGLQPPAGTPIDTVS